MIVLLVANFGKEAYSAPRTISRIGAGDIHTCALLSEGTLKCWGMNSNSQLGKRTWRRRSFTPVKVRGISNATAVTGGGSHTCALLSDGTVKCWGSNEYGQLGVGPTKASLTPVAVRRISNATGVAAGFGHTCVLLSNNTVKCWGTNSYGQLGNRTARKHSSIPLDVVGLSE